MANELLHLSTEKVQIENKDYFGCRSRRLLKDRPSPASYFHVIEISFTKSMIIFILHIPLNFENSFFYNIRL